MYEPWESYLTMSVVHFMAFPDTISGSGPIVETVRRLAEDDFFGAAEVTWIKDPKARAEVREIAQQSRLQLGFAAQPVILVGKANPNALDPAVRQRGVDALKAAIDEAAELGCKRMAFLTGPDAGDVDRPRALEALTDSVLTLCRYGREKGVALTLETFDRDVDKKSLVGPSGMAAEFAARIRAEFPDFGLLYDLSHMPLLRESVGEALGTLKDYLVHIHVGNAVTTPGAPAYGDLHPRFGFPGGSNDVAELTAFLKGLFEIGYLKKGALPKPWVGFEVKPQPGETTELILANTKRAWRQAWADLEI